MRKRVGMKRGAAYDDVMREISIMKKLSHKNIIQLYEVINDPSDDRLYMILEYAEKGPIMKGDIEHFTAIPEDIAKKYFYDVLDGLEYLHSLKVIHRDIKPENLLVTSDGTAKISDFGTSIILDNEDDESLKRTVGSPAFLAPELCSDSNGKVIGSAIDIWSLGASLYCFIFGSLPFTGETEMQLYDSIRNHEVTFPHQIDSELQDLITKMLIKDPVKRITLPEIKEHSWILGKTNLESSCRMDSSDGSITMET